MFVGTFGWIAFFGFLLTMLAALGFVLLLFASGAVQAVAAPAATMVADLAMAWLAAGCGVLLGYWAHRERGGGWLMGTAVGLAAAAYFLAGAAPKHAADRPGMTAGSFLLYAITPTLACAVGGFLGSWADKRRRRGAAEVNHSAPTPAG